MEASFKKKKTGGGGKKRAKKQIQIHGFFVYCNAFCFPLTGKDHVSGKGPSQREQRSLQPATSHTAPAPEPRPLRAGPQERK